MDTTSIADNTTVVAGPSSAVNRKELSHHQYDFVKGEGTLSTAPMEKRLNDFGRSADYTAEDRQFFITIGKEGVTGALQKLDQQLEASGRSKILSKKSPTDWIGHEVIPGTFGLMNHGGLPKVVLRPGRYPPFPLRNWWAREWVGTKGLSDTTIEYHGLTIVQVSQNQAAVISDPQNRIFVVKNSGFVAFAATGKYSVLAVVDQTHLPDAFKDKSTGTVLGWTHEVKMMTSDRAEYHVALFLNIPANNCAILQRGDDLELLPAGQHFITNPNVTLRGMYTQGEQQLELASKGDTTLPVVFNTHTYLYLKTDIYTRDQVPVSLKLYLKWQLTEPLKLTTHGYNNPFDALKDKTQSILTQIVAHLDYSSMVKQRSIGTDNMDDGSDPSSAFLDALRTRAMDDMVEAALEYGIVLKDLAVIDRQFKGDIAATMDKLTTRALQAQVEAANVDRENSNKVKQEEGALSVARIKAQARNTQADAEAYAVIAAAKATAERTKIEAEAQAEATRLSSQADAEAIRIRAQADASVIDQFAREMELRRVDVERVKAFGNKAVFVPSEGPGVAMAGMMGLNVAGGMNPNTRN